MFGDNPTNSLNKCYTGRRGTLSHARNMTNNMVYSKEINRGELRALEREYQKPQS